VVLPVNQPQLRFSIAGVPVYGAVSLDIESIAYFSADRFYVVFSIGADATSTTAFFSTLGAQIIDIETASDATGYASLIMGQIDNIRIDLAKNTATLSGRDLSAQLIDTEITETFANQTSSQIASTIAARHQLAQNITPTKTPVGQYYQLDHARNALGINSKTVTEWNLLSLLAEVEQFELSVTGTVLNFCPASEKKSVFFVPQNFMSLALDRATTLPGAATVRSWNSRQKTVISATGGQGAGVTIVRPNLTATQASAVTSAHLATLGRHGTILSGTMPGDFTLRTGMQMVLTGTESNFDQTYFVTEISRHIQPKTGFLQTVSAYAVG
jgi:hypothetical protein